MATVTETGTIQAVTIHVAGEVVDVRTTRYVRSDDALIGSVTTIYNRRYQTMTSALLRGRHGPVTFTMYNTGPIDVAWDQHARMLAYAEHNL